MKAILLLTICSLLAISTFAQGEKCGIRMFKEGMMARDPAFAARLDSVRTVQATRTLALKQAKMAGTASKTTVSGTVPIIFHIVLTAQQIAQLGGEAGIQERADSEIAVLNRDYNGANGDASLIPAAFKPVYGNAGISFGLARHSPTGACVPGYQITNTTVTGFDFNGITGSGNGFSDAKYDSSGGAGIWDTSTYLNVWVINPTGIYSGMLGLTVPKSFVGSSTYHFTSAEEGVVINYQAFGVKSPNIRFFLHANNADSLAFGGGRTLTHEIGHFFEIWHTWGDDNGLCPSDFGGSDDGMADTPPEGNLHQGSYYTPTPVPPLPTIIDSCSRTAPGVMYMNFMDYPDDPYALLFTQDQVTQMQTNFLPGGESYSLTTHPAVLDGTGCPNLSAANITISHTLTLSPNPTNGLVRIAVDNGSQLRNINVTNVLGQVVHKIIPVAKGAIYTIDMAGMQKGLYFVQCYFTDGMVSGKIILQ